MTDAARCEGINRSTAQYPAQVAKGGTLVLPFVLWRRVRGPAVVLVLAATPAYLGVTSSLGMT